jgi:hypothetical protein
VTYPSKKRKENEDSKAHSKGWSRAQRRTQKRDGVRKCTTLDGQWLKGALEKRQGLEGALEKGGRVRKRTTLDGQGLKGTLEKR